MADVKKRAYRPDWNCTCGNLVFGSKDECGKCGLFRSKARRAQAAAPTPPSAKQKPQYEARPGDWTCANVGCKDINFASRVQCRKCGQNKQQATTAAAAAAAVVIADTQRRLICAICMDDEPDARLQGCGHLAMCIACAEKTTTCPICRGAYTKEDIQKTFISAPSD